jgi:hypothetical protein
MSRHSLFVKGPKGGRDEREKKEQKKERERERRKAKERERERERELKSCRRRTLDDHDERGSQTAKTPTRIIELIGPADWREDTDDTGLLR